jgi:phospholipid/cholesterol/gamma-HCH transport system substrate-binding protein
METRANYALIGAFTLAVIAGGFAFVFWFSGGDKPANRQVLRLAFTSSVSGLARGSWVLFNGLRVGEVTKIDLGEDPRIVYAMIDIDRRTPIRADTRARLEYQGLTGAASVALSGGTLDAPALVRDTDGGPPTLQADPSQIQNIVETLQGLSGKIDGLLEKADRVLGDNSGSISKTMKNIETLSQTLADHSDGVGDFMQSMGELGRGLKPFVETLSRNTGNVDAIVQDTRALVAKLNESATKIDGVLTSAQGFLGQPGSKGMLDDVADAAKSMRKLADNLDQRTKDIAAGIKQFTGPGLRQYEALAADGRRTLEEVNRTVRSLEKNPQQLLFGSKPQVPEYSGR